ncbi:hypothetical protein ISCGN_016470 [Ixodes scapularis]
MASAGIGTGSLLGSERMGALAAASWRCAGRFSCADGTDVFSESAPLIAAIAMDTSHLSEIRLDMLRYCDSMGLVPYDGMPVGKCGESSGEDSSFSTESAEGFWNLPAFEEVFQRNRRRAFGTCPHSRRTL